MNPQLKALLLKIPKGKVTTYKELAIQLKTSPRAIGKMLNTNTELITIPCHRVIHTNRDIGGYKNGQTEKIKLLKNEQIIFENNNTKIAKQCIYKYKI
jgi:methylated-DNA-[protein]-cysteine S-methyltransferase